MLLTLKNYMYVKTCEQKKTDSMLVHIRENVSSASLLQLDIIYDFDILPVDKNTVKIRKGINVSMPLYETTI
jgi:hypothetical protein